VWLASGQSNMEMELGKHGWSEGVRDWQREVAAADLPSLRFFTVGKNAAEVRAEAVDGEWVVCSPATAGTFSATAFFFARELLQAGKGPLGVVVSAWGGTVCEAWTSPTGLATFPEFAAKLTAPTGHAVSREQRRQQFWAAVDAAGVGAPAIDVELPGAFSATGLGDFDGAVEYRRRVALPEALRGHDLWLELGPIDDMDTVWWGERQLGGADDDGAWSTPRRYRVPAAWTAVAAVELRVRVVDTGGEGGLTGDSASMRLAGNDQAVPLAGTWQRRLVAPLASLPPWPRRDDPNQPARLWHGMIAPLVPFPFTGAIWYQGESNRGRATQYAKLFPAMIEDWRRAFAGPLPFYFVQIAPYEYGPAGETKTAELRAAQAAALALPNTGMVVTLDCGDAKDIHPTHKQPVGQRLAALARAGHYGDAVPHRGPVATTARRERDAVELTFDAPAGVRLANDGAGFELASADGRFVPATAEVRDGKVVVRAAGIAEPNHVRYAWAAVPAWSLLGGDGCLAAPFALVVR
jgi:sialate O-acetylesterase